ncbi:MAG: hypothetical protein H7336_16235 [Bacteriovorax sp.]|nr:hypothetical protein [Bacteriovorax sp.]
MKAMSSLLLVLALFATSCSSPTWFHVSGVDRHVAAEINPPLNADQLFTIKSTSQTQIGKNYVKDLVGQFSYKGVAVEFVEDLKLSNDIAYNIVPTVENQAYKIKIIHSVQAKVDEDAQKELVRVMNQLMTTKFTSQFSVFELYFNAKTEDFISLQVLAKVRAAAITAVDNYNADEEYITRSADRIKYWENINEKFKHEERIYNKQVKVQDEARRVVMDALDKAADDEQFRSLVAKNDRKGAAKLLRSYLPWEQMPPFEKMFWENHLAIMVDPLPYEDRILIYRGIDDDIVQVAQQSGKEMSREEAIKEQKIFLMSTMMTKNQGTWNRRLRSLTAMYEKFMGTDANNSSEYVKSTRITNMFVKHSREPKGSPFLSYTPKFSIASSFGSKRNTAYFIDPRMMYFNYASKFASEVEFLLPIMSFPDELAAVYDSTIFPIGQGQIESFMKEKAIKKLDEQLGAGKGTKAFERIELNSKKYFAPVMGGKVGAVAPPKPDGKFISFFKSLLGMNTKKVAEVIDEKSNMPCLDLIQMFWK